MGKIDSVKNSFEFDIVFKNGVYFHRDFMSIHAMKTRDFAFKISQNMRRKRTLEANILLGFSINKKVAKAHLRNKIKRQIKAIIQNLIHTKNLHNLSMIFVCRAGVLELDFLTLKKHIESSIFKLLNMLQKNILAQKNIVPQKNIPQKRGTRKT